MHRVETLCVRLFLEILTLVFSCFVLLFFFSRDTHLPRSESVVPAFLETMHAHAVPLVF